MAIKIGDWLVDRDLDTITCGSTRHKLERRAMATLTFLADNAGKVVSKEMLIDAIWGGAAVSDHSVAIVISQLRRALGDDRASPQYIETIPKRGYRLLASVSNVDDAATHAPATAPRLASLSRRQALLVGGGAVAVAVAGFAAWQFRSVLRPRYALAIADFDSANDDASREMAFGLTQLVTTTLAERSETQVIRWRGATDAAGIAQLARVANTARIALLTGYVFVDRGTRVVSVQARDAARGNVIFASVYQVQQPDLLAHAARIAEDASNASGSTRLAPQSGPSAPADVVAQYWQAEYHLASGAPGSPRRGRDMLVDIIEHHPDFAPAHSALARTYSIYTPETLGLQGFDHIAAARHHLAVARSLHGLTADDAETSAMIEFFEARDSGAALAFAETATRLRPSHPRGWQIKALILSVQGRDDEALEAIRHAQALDPASGDIRWDHVWFLYISGAYQEAIEEGDEAALLSGSYPLYRALVEDALGRAEDAFRSWLSRQRQHGMSQVQAQVLLATFRRDGARHAYRALVREMPAQRPETGVPLAILLMRAGDREGAVEALNSPILTYDRWLSLFLDRIPILHDLRSDPRLEGVYARIEEFRG